MFSSLSHQRSQWTLSSSRPVTLTILPHGVIGPAPTTLALGPQVARPLPRR